MEKEENHKSSKAPRTSKPDTETKQLAEKHSSPFSSGDELNWLSHVIGPTWLNLTNKMPFSDDI